MYLNFPVTFSYTICIPSVTVCHQPVALHTAHQTSSPVHWTLWADHNIQQKESTHIYCI